MSDEAYVSAMTYSAYGPASSGNGSISINSGTAHTHFQLDDDDKSLLRELASKIVNKHKVKFAEQITSIDVTPQLTYDSSKTINSDDDIHY